MHTATGGILPCSEMLLSLDNQRNGICKAYPERQIQRQLLMYEVRLVEQGLLSGGLSGWGAVRFQGLRLSSRHVRQSVAALTAV